MKILYIGPYRQQDGWGNASRLFLSALNKTGHDITIKPIFMGSSKIEGSLGPELDTLESNRFDNYDVLIQHTLPDYFEYHGDFGKNIGMFFSETGSLQYTNWISQCNLLDEIWVSSYIERDNLLDSGVTKPIKIVPIPTDVKKYQQSYDKLIVPQFEKIFNFYFVGEYIQRKNIPALLMAFNLEFGQAEPVNLVIKTNKGGVHPVQLLQQVQADIKHLKETLRVYHDLSRYPVETIITDFLSEQDMCKLHTSCDCFVMPSRGEAWSLPAMDALGFGKPVISTSNIGTSQFVNNENGWNVLSHTAPVLASDPPMVNLYTGRETWQNIDIIALRAAMREAFENKEKYKNKSSVALDTVYEYTFEKVAEQIKCLL